MTKPACVSLLLALAASLPGAQAQAVKWPERPVRLVVPVPPGGGIDMVGRIVSAKLSEDFGQQFVVDNRTGAGGVIGSQIAAHATPDGYTMLVFGSSYPANAALYKLSYDPVKGIATVGTIGNGAYVLTVHPSVKAGTLKEFIDLARAQPGALNFGSAGTGSIPHLSVELLQQLTGIRMLHVPYKGVGPALTDLLAGRLQVFVASTLAASPHVKAGKLRGIAVTSEQRSPAFPDLPAIHDLVPGYSAGLWYGMWAPAGTPKEIIARTNQALARMVKLPDVVERLRNDGVEPAHSTPEEQARRVAREIATWTKVVKTANIRVD